jgi:glycerol uptake facilitator-like aquaporin
MLDDFLRHFVRWAEVYALVLTVAWAFQVLYAMFVFMKRTPGELNPKILKPKGW